MPLGWSSRPFRTRGMPKSCERVERVRNKGLLDGIDRLEPAQQGFDPGKSGGRRRAFADDPRDVGVAVAEAPRHLRRSGIRDGIHGLVIEVDPLILGNTPVEKRDGRRLQERRQSGR